MVDIKRGNSVFGGWTYASNNLKKKPKIPETIQPYMLEPFPRSQMSQTGGPSSASQVSIDEEKEDDDINTNRIGHTQW